MKRTKNRINQISILLVLVVMIQFFWVYSHYKIIESEKVMIWTLLFGLPMGVLLSFYLKKKIYYVLFYSTRKHCNSTSRIDRIKNTLTFHLLIIFVFCFFFYDTIIQTNDWFGNKKKHTFSAPILKSETIQHGRRKNRNTTYDLTIPYNGNLINLSSHKPYKTGEIFQETIILGGFWGILYSD